MSSAMARYADVVSLLFERVCATPASTATTDTNSEAVPSGRLNTPTGDSLVIPRCAAGDRTSDTIPAVRRRSTPAVLSGCVAHHVPR